jgi:predicted dehydrogenase
MLAGERLDVVGIGPRQPDQREEMVLAAVDAGVRAIYTEKPCGRSLDEADRILAACDARGVKVAVAHQNRGRPGPAFARRLLQEGKIGRLRSMRALGKQDQRGGGQDLMVLGTHMLDLMRSFAGDARWCNARVLEDGAPAGPSSVRPAGERAGLIAGDDVVATYGFDAGILGTYESMRARDGESVLYFTLELHGTEGVLAFRSTTATPVYYLPRPFVLPDRPAEWEVLPAPPLETPPAAAPPPADASTLHEPNQVIVRDLLAAVEQGREPLSSGRDYRAALEMVMAVYESHIRDDRVTLPLPDRTHPLSRWRTSHA